jgi:hypothetical protein
LRQLLTDLRVAGRLGARILGRRLRGSFDESPAPDLATWRTELERWVGTVPAGLLEEHRFVELPATRPPWTGTGLHLVQGQALTWLATGRVYLSRALDIWVEPSFQLWGRIGDHGEVFRGTRTTHSFVAGHAGELHVASYFPGEWSTPEGAVGSGAGEYRKVSGSMTVLLLAWRPGINPASWLRNSASQPDSPEPVRAEAERLETVQPKPDGWDYLWYLGPGEIYRSCAAPDGRPAICCETRGDVGILQRPAPIPLVRGTKLQWKWRVDRLPASMREDSLPTHEYMSIAVEFDDGQDITYYWSAELPEGTIYRCPLPTWKDKETHVVVRSGPAGLGQWLDEQRDLHEDYRRIIGGPARSVVKVWLIANSLFHRARGQCEYSAIEISSPDGRRVAVL